MKTDLVRPYPLCWPVGWPQLEQSQREAVHITHDVPRLDLSDAVERVLVQLVRLDIGLEGLVISCNIEKLESWMAETCAGRRRAARSRLEDARVSNPGVALYWREDTTRFCMALDRYTSVAANLGAIAATLEAMHHLARVGSCTILDRAFTGLALRAPEPESLGDGPEQWFTILGVSSDATDDEIKLAHRRLVAANPEVARLDTACDEGLSRAKS